MIKRNLLSTVVAIITAMMIWSCSNSDTRDYRDYVSNDYLLVHSVNALSVLENAGFTFNSSGIVPPEIMKEFVSQHWTKMQDILKVEGVDPRQMVIAIDSIKDCNISLFVKLSNSGKFAKYIEGQLQFKKVITKSGVDYYSNGQSTCAIDGSLAIVSSKSVDVLSNVLPKMRANAKSNPLPDWKVRAFDKDVTSVTILDINQMMGYIKSLPPSAFTKVADNASLKDAAILIDSELKDLTFKSTFRTVDASGNTITPIGEVGKFDKSLLAYSSSVDRLVGIGALPSDPSWKETIVEMLRSSVGVVDESVIGMFKDLEGTVMLSVGYNSIMGLSTGRGLHCALALECAPGTIDSVYNSWYEALKLGTPPYSINDNGSVITIEYGAFKFYITKKDNILVGCTDPSFPTTGDELIPASEFGDYASQMILKIPYADASITAISLPFSLDFDMHSDGTVGVFSVDMGNTDGKMLENTIKLIANVR